SVNWGDGNEVQTGSPPSHVYTIAGDYYLRVEFQNDNIDSLQIRVRAGVTPEFTAFACSNRRVEISIPDNNYDNYIINFGDGNTQTVSQGTPDIIYTYANNNLRTITVRGIDVNAADNCPNASQQVQPVTALTAGTITSVQVLDNATAVLNYNYNADIQHQLQISQNGNTAFAPFKTYSTAVTSDTISGINFSENYFCFRLAALNDCDNTTDDTSDAVCSIDLDLVVEDGFNALTWSTQNPDLNFELFRDDLGASPLTTISNVSARSFDDNTVLCNTNYCYTLVANYNNGVTSTSGQVCGTAFTTQPPPAVEEMSIQVAGDEISLFWPEISSSNELTYSIYKSFDNNLQLIDTTTSAGFTISSLNTQVQHCFQIQVADNCGNSNTNGVVACSIFLQGTIDRSDQVNLSWSNYDGWDNGVAQYTVSKLYETGSGGTNTTTETNFSEVDNSNNQVIFYRVTATPNDNLNISSSNTVRLIKPNNIYFPNAFTPDGNGTNDTFAVNGRFIVSYELKIFNRWGEMVFFSTSMENGWNGVLNSQALEEGTYVFTVSMTDEAGRKIERDGSIVLLRK
ncbi:MAG: gliding motility-associated C-terminal domain-containing protein, partial [Fulvivirga sp.]|nr:gliding motility-associated C-terminal domain-containing protein [Fulvivirga sp.]